MFWKREIGNKGERLAVQFLKRRGLRVLEHSYRTKAGEIDIVTQDQESLCFVEVKVRKNRRFGTPAEAVDDRKQQQISKAALWYLQSKKLTDVPCRFDVIAIEYDENEKPQIQWIKNAFELSVRYRY